MSKNQNFNYLEWVKREKEEDEKRTDGNRSEKVVGVILLLGTFLFAVYLIFNLISEVGKVQKGTDNEPIEVPIEHEPTQMEMNGWREPSALDIIIHSDSGSQEPDTVGLSFFISKTFLSVSSKCPSGCNLIYPLKVVFKRLTGGDCLQNRRGGRKSDL